MRSIADGSAARTALNAELGRLRAQLQWFVRSLQQGNPQRGEHCGYAIDGQVHEVAAAETVEFWEALLAMSQSWEIRFSHYGNITTAPLLRADLDRLLGDDFDLAAWTARSHDVLDADKRELEHTLTVLRHADYRALLALDEFTIEFGSAPRTFAMIVGDIAGSALVADLIAQGYIDPYYCVYVSQYYGGRVSAKAMKFLMNNVASNTPDTHYDLAATDVEAVVRETRATFLNDLSGYNIAVLDYLLVAGRRVDSGPLADTDLADVLLGHIVTRWGEHEQKFLNSYFTGGHRQHDALMWATRNWSEVFTFLARDADIAVAARIRFTSIVLLASEPTMTYTLDDDVRAFLTRYYSQINAIVGDHTGTETAATFDILDKAGFVCEDLAVVAPRLRERLVTAGRYRCSAANLKSAAATADIGLDTLWAASRQVYEFALADPRSFRAAFDDDTDTEFVITDPAAFAGILDDLIATTGAHDADTDADTARLWTGEHLDWVLANAAPACHITDLAHDANTTLWPTLARASRFTLTLNNVHTYLADTGSIDEELAGHLLRTGSIDTSAENPAPAESMPTAADRKMTVALAVLNASSTLPDADFRTDVVERLDLTDWVDVTAVTAEHGRLLSLLIMRHICEDSAATFAHFPCQDWDTLHPAILASGTFADFVNPDLLDEHSVERLFTTNGSALTAAQTTVLQSLEAFTPHTAPAALLAAGRYAIDTGHRLAAPHIERIAAATHDPVITIALVSALPASQIAAAEIEQILSHLPDNYPKLNQPGQSFTLPADDLHRGLLTRLKREGRVEKFVHRRATGRFSVTTKT
ncbi:hypothetical protein [Nocardia sp. NBC_00511]|uniref:hypothetical protein n=1 Tax=Nocardia sp. NBC_00511 TaxID=2903591 RepID=UPI002F908FF3